MAFVLAEFHLLAEDSGRGAAPAFVLIVAEGATAVGPTSAAPTVAVIAVGIAGAVVRVSPGMDGEPLSTAGTTCAGLACATPVPLAPHLLHGSVGHLAMEIPG